MLTRLVVLIRSTVLSRSQALSGLTQKRHFWSLCTLACLLLFSLVRNPQFFALQVRDGHLYGSLIDIMNRGAPLIVIALGLTLVIATQGIDISVGAVVAIAAAVAASAIGGELMVDGEMQNVTRFPLPVVILATLAVATLCGMWNGLLISYVGLQPIITTLILLVTGRGIAQLITGGQIITIYYSPYNFIGNGFLFGLPFSVFIVAIVFGALLLFTRKSALGLFIESIGINPIAARFAGIRSRAITFWVYSICGLCAGIAGLIVSSNVRSADGNNAGLLFELDAILAVVLGGTSLSGGRFTLVGSVIGALIIQTLTTTIYAVGVAPEVTLVVKAVVVFLVSILQSDRFKFRTDASQRAETAT